MPEWSNGAVSKTVDRSPGPRVRIPLPPQKKTIVNKTADNQYVGSFIFYIYTKSCLKL